MDVSKLKADGSGAHPIKQAGPKSKKFSAGRGIVSDNKRGINNAAKLLGDESLVANWVAASGNKTRSPRKRTAAAGSRSRSASRSPSASRSRSASRSASRTATRSRSTSRASSPARTLPMSNVSSPIGVPVVRTSPRGSLNLPPLPGASRPTIGSPRTSPRL